MSGKAWRGTGVILAIAGGLGFIAAALFDTGLWWPAFAYAFAWYCSDHGARKMEAEK